ncbi:MAG: hypothetical protein IKO06_01065 [Alphaproteobacteria bacterium]|nr:hypothetical protein [Alphaproteobacteria bacterium]
MKYLYVLLMISMLACCGKDKEEEVYNENNTNVVNGVVYDIYDKPINGIYKAYHGNGSVRMEMNARKGLPDGDGRFYDENGNLAYSITFKNGKLNGKFYHYYEDGNIHNELNYVDGEQSGTQILYDEKGQQVVDLFYENNKAVKGYVFVDGEKIEFDEDELKELSFGPQNIEEELALPQSLAEEAKE